jgi:hypothetical protein
MKIHRAGGGAGGSANHAYYTRLAALLEPEATAVALRGANGYTQAADTTEYLTASWATRIGATGRVEVRDPARPLPLRNVTLTGTETGAFAMVNRPSLVTYTDARDTYFDRLAALDDLDTREIAVTGAGTQRVPFLPGAYGAIITSYTVFDKAWGVIAIDANTGIAYNLANEISDADTIRTYNRLHLAVPKGGAGWLEASSTGSGKVSLTYALLPSTWSTATDPFGGTYDLRLPLTANTTGLNLTQSTGGNVAVASEYQWLKVTGNGNFGQNGAISSASVARSGSPVLVIDIAPPISSGNGPYVGFTSSSGIAHTAFYHCLLFGGTGQLYIFENSTQKYTAASYWKATIYRVRITALSGGGATYEIQGGPTNPAVGAATWTTITLDTATGGTDATLYPALGHGGNDTAYFSDLRVY